jgi:iron(III) transport system permease protein
MAKLRYYWWNPWALAALLILVTVSVPLLAILLKLLAGPGESWEHLISTQLAAYWSNTSLLLLGVGLLCSLIGIGTAWLVSAYDFPVRRQFEWLLILPLCFPSYIMAYAYVGLLDYTGPLQVFLKNHLGLTIKGSLLDIMNLPGAAMILSFTLFPYVFILARASFLLQSRELQEAAYLLGSSRRRAFFKVALPLARPAIAAGLALAGMEVLNDYGTVKYFGVSTFTTGIFRAWFSMGDLPTAIYLAAMLMVLVFLLLYAERRQRGQRSYAAAATAKPFIRAQVSRRSQLGFTSICSLVLAVSFLLPLLQLVYWVGLTWQKVLSSEFFLLIYRSFSLAAIAGVAVALLSVVLLYAARLSPFAGVKNLGKFATLGYAIPGAVIAVGVMIPLLASRQWLAAALGSGSASLASSTLLALSFAYIVRFMAVGYNPLESGFQKIGLHVNEASRLLGSSSWRTLWRIELPLLKASLLSAVLLVFVDVLKELPLTLILRPFNYHTLATKAFDMATNEMAAESASAALVIILAGVGPIVWLNHLMRAPKHNNR